MSKADAAWNTVVDNGPSANRVDVVILGDGYTASDLATGAFDLHVGSFLNYLFSQSPNTEPFGRYRSFFNVHTVEVVSNESGADVPPENVFRDTAFDATYWYDGVTERLLYVDDAKANAARDAALVGAGFSAEMQFLTVNDTKFGGGGGPYATFAGGNSQSSEIALHEVAHSFSNLADEYVSDGRTYTGPEPSPINVTTDPAGGKWSAWLGYDQPGIGIIGAYEGALQFEKGVYRPSLDSKMRSLDRPFDVVSRERIVLDIYQLVDPLDSWTPNVEPLVDPTALAVDRVDESVIDLEWRVDGQLLAGAIDNVLDVAALALAPGAHLLSARAFDPTAFDATDGWVRTDSSALEQTIDWQVLITPSDFLPGDYDGDRVVSGADHTRWRSHFGQQVDPFTSADGNGDGLVDLADFTIWRDHLGERATFAAPGVQVPEPATRSLLVLGLLAVRWCRPARQFILAHLA